MKTIILDTSFLVACVEAKVDFIKEIERICTFSYTLAIIDKTRDELRNITTRGGKKKTASRVAQLILDTHRVHEIKTSKHGIVDTLILDHAGKDTIVATMDAHLKEALKHKRITVIVLRQRAYAAFL